MNISVFAISIVLLWSKIPPEYLRGYESISTHEPSCYDFRTNNYGSLFHLSDRPIFPCGTDMESDKLEFGRLLVDLADRVNQLINLLFTLCLENSEDFSCKYSNTEFIISGPLNPQGIFLPRSIWEGYEYGLIDLYPGQHRELDLLWSRNLLGISPDNCTDIWKRITSLTYRDTGFQIENSTGIYKITPWINPKIYNGKLARYIYKNLYNPDFGVRYLKTLNNHIFDKDTPYLEIYLHQ